MQMVYERCAALAVHQKVVVACVLVSGPNHTVRPFCRGRADKADSVSLPRADSVLAGFHQTGLTGG
jgi:hypothetical protein